MHQSKACKCGLYRSEPASDWSGCIVGQPQSRRVHNEKNDIHASKYISGINNPIGRRDEVYIRSSTDRKNGLVSRNSDGVKYEPTIFFTPSKYGLRDSTEVLKCTLFKCLPHNPRTSNKRQKRKDKNSGKLRHRRGLKSANQNETRNPAANQNAANDKPANYHERIVTDAHLDSFYRTFGGSRRHIRSNQKFGKRRRAVTLTDFSSEEEQLGKNRGKYRRALNSTIISFGEDDDAFSEDCGMGERVRALKCVDENDTPVHPG